MDFSKATAEHIAISPLLLLREGMWELLTDILPVWKRLEEEEGEEAEEGEEEGEQPATHHEGAQERNAIVLASFAAGVGNRPLQPSLVVEMVS